MALFAAGCQPAPSPDSQSVPTDATTPAVADAAFLEITPAARTQLRATLSAQDQAVTWRLRIAIVPGGCQGRMAKLDLDADPPAAGDSEFLAGGVRCVYRAEQEAVVRGGRIDWVDTVKETGFAWTFPPNK